MRCTGGWIPYIAAVLFPYPCRIGPFLGDQLFERVLAPCDVSLRASVMWEERKLSPRDL